MHKNLMLQKRIYTTLLLFPVVLIILNYYYYYYTIIFNLIIPFHITGNTFSGLMLLVGLGLLTSKAFKLYRS